MPFPQAGSSSSGMKMPLMKTKENFTMEESIWMVAGMLVGGEENMSPSEEKQEADRIIPRARMKGWSIFTPATRPTKMGTMEMATPKIEEASISPKIIVDTTTGQDTSLGATAKRSRIE